MIKFANQTSALMTNANKTHVLEYVKQVLQQQGHNQLDRFVAEDLIQQSPNIAAGRNGLAAWLGSTEAGAYEMPSHLIGEGDFVVTYGKRYAGGRTSSRRHLSPR